MSRTSVVLIFIGAVLTSIGAGLFMAFQTGDTLRHHQATSWPTTQGTITRSEVVSFRGSKGRTNYRPVVEYSFTHEGRIYRSSRIHDRRESSSSSQTSASERLRGYNPGSAVTVSINPDDPADSQLEPGVNDKDRGYLGLAAASVLGSLFMWAWAFFAAKRRGPGFIAGKLLIPGPPIRVRTVVFGNFAGAVMAASITVSTASTILGLGFGLSWLGLGLILAAGVAMGALTYWAMLASDAKGKGDLVLDLESELVITPKLPDSPAGSTPYAAVTGARTDRMVRGSGKSRAITFEVRLMLGEATGPTAAVFSNASAAEEFGVWLRQQLALDPPAA